MKKIVLYLIERYRKTGGSRHWFGIECNYEPTCSKYTYSAIDKLGLYKGIKLGFNRIKNCNHNDTICKCIDPFEE